MTCKLCPKCKFYCQSIPCCDYTLKTGKIHTPATATACKDYESKSTSRRKWDMTLARAMYDDGKSCKEIAAAVDVSLDTVNRWARWQGLTPIRGKIDPDVARKMYADGVQVTKIAAHFGVSVGAVHNWRMTAGIPPRTKAVTA